MCCHPSAVRAKTLTIGVHGANPDQFVVFFTLDITPKATGQRTTREEVAVYTVKNDKITREQFFYDGTH